MVAHGKSKEGRTEGEDDSGRAQGHLPLCPSMRCPDWYAGDANT